MKTYDNIKTTISHTESKQGNRYTYNVEIHTQELIKAFHLSDVEMAQVLQALKILDKRRFKESD